MKLVIEKDARRAERRIRSALDESPIYDLRTLQVELSESGVVVSGQVSSYYHKQLAIEAARAVGGAAPFVNQIDVT
jgi:osmotically-inducible protein OsmY